MKQWIITGISGSGRIELLNELKKYAATKGKNISVHDVGKIIFKEAKRLDITLSDNRVLDIDKNLLGTLRENALKEVEILNFKNPTVNLHLIGIHATFRWKHRIIEGMSFRNLSRFNIKDFINVVEDVESVYKTNSINKKWDKDTLPNTEETQNWLIEEEFVTKVISDFFDKPFYIIARRHKISNLFDLFFTKKKKIYLSYPITAIKDSDPELLQKIQTEYLEQLEDLFVVFNPLSIKDMSLTYGEKTIQLLDSPDSVAKVTEKTKEIIKSRTVERDFRFIDQSDATVVIYPTDKVSPGVLAEIIYSHNNQKPVFIYFSGSRSPFLEHYATYMTSDFSELLVKLQKFSNRKKTVPNIV